MKKILAVLSSMSLVSTPITVISCAAKKDDDQKDQNILDVINLSKVNIKNIEVSKFLNETNTYLEMDAYINEELVPQVVKLINEEYKLDNYVKAEDLIYIIRDQNGRSIDLSHKDDKLKNGKWYLDFCGNKRHIGGRATTILTIKGSNLDYVSLNALNLPMVDFMTKTKDYISDLKENKANLIINEIESQLNDELKGTFTKDELVISLKYQENVDKATPKFRKLINNDKIGGRFNTIETTYDPKKVTYRHEWYTFIKINKPGITGELKYLHRVRESAVWLMDIDSFKIHQFVTGTATTEDVINAVMNEDMRKIFIEDLSPYISSKWAGENFPKVSEWHHVNELLDPNLRPKDGEVYLNTRGSFTLKLAFNDDWKTEREHFYEKMIVLKNDDILKGYIELWINIV